MAVDLPGGGIEQTQWVYGVSGSTITSNDLLKEVRWPDPTTGSASSSEADVTGYNALGQRTTMTDRNGTVHGYSYDVVGRATADAVTTLGTGIDGSVRRIETAYDGQGNAYLVTSYDAATSGSAVNQVQRAFNGLRQLTAEYQAVSGSVNTSTTPKVQYAYSEMPSGANHSRPTSMTYPGGWTLTYDYGTSAGLDDRISRLSALKDGSTTVEGYSYLGQGTVVKRTHPQASADLTFVKLSGESNGDAGDQYTGLDRFGRVVDQRWVDGSGNALDREQYGYDRDGNRLYADNLLNNSFDELYHANGASAGYDGLNQLSAFRRGALSDADSDGRPDTITTASRSQVWTADAVGNFTDVTTDGTGQTRTHNRQNEITAVSGATTPTYDAAGNLTKDQAGTTYSYDVWGRVMKVNGTTRYGYDGLGRRTAEGSRALYYTANWQVVEERESGVAVVRNVWSPVYIDGLVLRDRDADANGSLEERLYAIQDGNWNVQAVVGTDGAVKERYAYDPYGVRSVLTAAWAGTTTGYAWVVGHQGGRLDGATGNYHFRNRDLLADLMRWNRNDPIGYRAGDLDLYRAYLDNPTSWIDPSGLQGIPIPIIPDRPIVVPIPRSLPLPPLPRLPLPPWPIPRPIPRPIPTPIPRGGGGGGSAAAFGELLGELIESTGAGNAIGEWIGDQFYPNEIPATKPRSCDDTKPPKRDECAERWDADYQRCHDLLNKASKQGFPEGFNLARWYEAGKKRADGNRKRCDNNEKPMAPWEAPPGVDDPYGDAVNNWWPRPHWRGNDWQIELPK